MNTLFRLCRGTQVKILQGLLSVKGFECDIDGIFGAETTAMVKLAQRKNSLAVDGIVGKQTWQALGVAPWSNTNILTMRLPFTEMHADVLLKNGQKYSVKEFGQHGGYDVVVNGPMFDMLTRRNIVDMVIKG